MKERNTRKDKINELYPRTASGPSATEKRVKEATSFEGSFTGGFGSSILNASGGQGGSATSRVPGRRYYDPTLMSSSLYLPRDFKLKNKWRRWFYTHDPVVGMVLDTHSELPHGSGEIVTDDPSIKRLTEEMFEEMQLFSTLPLVDLEFMKIGEVTLYDLFDTTKGYFTKTVIHNPDFVEVSASQLAPDEPVVELRPSTDLKRLVMSSNPRDIKLKRRIPKQILARVATGRNIPLEPEYTTRLTRLANPYDIRGTSILDRLFRCYVPGTLCRMSNGSCKPIEEVKIGDLVISKDGESRKVQDVVSYDIDDNIVRITTHKEADILESTLGHKYLVRRNHNSNWQLPNYEMMKIGAEEIKEGDELLIPIGKETVEQDDINESKARLLGYFAAEGWFSETEKLESEHTINWCFNLNEKETWAKDVTTILEEEFNIDAQTREDLNDHSIWIWVKNLKKYGKLKSFIRKYIRGDRAHNKHYSEEVMTLPKNLQMQILIGHGRGDGSRDKVSDNFNFSTSSKTLAEQLSTLCFRNSLYNRLLKVNRKKVRETWNQEYQILLMGRFSRSFIKKAYDEYIPYFKEEDKVFSRFKEMEAEGLSFPQMARRFKKEGFKTLKGQNISPESCRALKRAVPYSVYGREHGGIEVDDTHFYIRVEKVEIEPYKGKVYDITVDTNHWWLANGRVVTSNTLMYEDKIYEAQITVADNFIFPLKIFKLGDPQSGWVPDETHMIALQELLLQQHFDPNFSLIFHYGLQYEQHGFEGKILRLDREWERIDSLKMVSLGVSKQFLTGETTYASANAALQVLLSKYQAKRMFFENKWINKLLKHVAKENGWYQRSKREVNNRFISKGNALEEEQKLIIPQIDWRKKLQTRDDQQFLSYLNSVYKDGTGPISHSTFLSASGFDFTEEIKKKKNDADIEAKEGWTINGPTSGTAKKQPKPEGGAGGGPGAAPGGGLELSPPTIEELPTASFLDKFRKKVGNLIFKSGKSQDQQISEEDARELLKRAFVDLNTDVKEIFQAFPDLKDSLEDDFFIGKKKKSSSKEKMDVHTGALINTFEEEEPDFFFNNINSRPFVNSYFKQNARFALGDSISDLFSQLETGINKKISSMISKEKDSIHDVSEFISKSTSIFNEALGEPMHQLYRRGKLYSYSKTNFLVHKNFLQRKNNLEDLAVDGFVDTIVVDENITLFDYLHNQILKILTKDKPLEEVDTKKITEYISLLIKMFVFHMFNVGVLKGYEEQGFENVECEYKTPDILNSADIQPRNFVIADLFSSGETSFSLLYNNPFLFSVEPVYEEGLELAEGFNDKITFSKNGINIVDCPYVYSEFVSQFLDKDFKYGTIKFIQSEKEIANLGAIIEQKVKDIKKPELRMATYQGKLLEFSQSNVVAVDDTLYIKFGFLKENFKKNFIERVSNRQEELSFEKLNFDKQDFEELKKSGFFIEKESNIFSIKKGFVAPTTKMNKSIKGLLNLISDFGLYDNFLWSSEGKLLSNALTIKNIRYAHYDKLEVLQSYFPEILK